MMPVDQYMKQAPYFLNRGCAMTCNHSGEGPTDLWRPDKKEDGMPNKVKIDGVWETRRIFLDGKELLPDRSQKLVNHSPDGFNWSYGGSGPAQLALAILLEIQPDVGWALEHYQDFKWGHVAKWPESHFTLELDVDEVMGTV